MSINLSHVIAAQADARPWGNAAPLIGDADLWPIDGLGEHEDFDIGAHGELHDILRIDPVSESEWRTVLHANDSAPGNAFARRLRVL